MATTSAISQEDAARVAAGLVDRAELLAGRSILVTGAGGFLLSGLLDALAAWNDRGEAEPLRILALDDFSSGLPERVAHLRDRSDFHWIRGTLPGPLPELEAALGSDVPDYLVHGASIASPPMYRRFPLETIDVNVGGTRQMLELANRGACAMVFLSSSEIYGDPEPTAIPTPETYLGRVSCTGPRACYDESKRLGETLCTTFYRLFETQVRILRPFNIYGPGQRLDDGRIIPDLMRAAIERKALVLHSDGRPTRAYCYASDAIRGLLDVLLLGEAGEAYNLGNDQRETSVRELSEMVQCLGPPPAPEIRFEVSADGDYLTDNPQRRCPDLSKLRALSGFAPSVDLETGLARVYDSYCEARVGPR